MEEIRVAVGLSKDTTDFDTELIMHINSAIGELNQNGVGSITSINGVGESWTTLLSSAQLEGNEYFHMVPLFIALSVKIIFDPPPPSAVEYYSKSIYKLLWRLKVAYEEPTPNTTVL